MNNKIYEDFHDYKENYDEFEDDEELDYESLSDSNIKILADMMSHYLLYTSMFLIPNRNIEKHNTMRDNMIQVLSSNSVKTIKKALLDPTIIIEEE